VSKGKLAGGEWLFVRILGGLVRRERFIVLLRKRRIQSTKKKEHTPKKWNSLRKRLVRS